MAVVFTATWHQAGLLPPSAVERLGVTCRSCSSQGPESQGEKRRACNSKENEGEIERISEENLQENLSHTKQGRRETGGPGHTGSGEWLLPWGRLEADGSWQEEEGS